MHNKTTRYIQYQPVKTKSYWDSLCLGSTSSKRKNTFKSISLCDGGTNEYFWQNIFQRTNLLLPSLLNWSHLSSNSLKSPIGSIIGLLFLASGTASVEFRPWKCIKQIMPTKNRSFKMLNKNTIKIKCLISLGGKGMSFINPILLLLWFG